MGSFQTRDQTHVPCIGRWILNHCATREAPVVYFKLLLPKGKPRHWNYHMCVYRVQQKSLQPTRQHSHSGRLTLQKLEVLTPPTLTLPLQSTPSPYVTSDTNIYHLGLTTLHHSLRSSTWVPERHWKYHRHFQGPTMRTKFTALYQTFSCSWTCISGKLSTTNPHTETWELSFTHPSSLSPVMTKACPFHLLNISQIHPSSPRPQPYSSRHHI